MRHLLPLIAGFLSLPALAADAAVSEAAYARAIDLIDRLYLRPEEIDAVRLLHAAANGLANEIDWLIVEPSGDAVYLHHGDGTPIGSVSVASMATLPAALRSLEALVAESGFDTRDVDVRLEILRGATMALDRYSRVLAGEKLDRFDVRLKGTLVGIGAQVDLVDQKLVITSLTADGPALAAGLRVGDVILRVEGQSTVNMPVKQAMSLIRGEVDTPVALTVQRGTQLLELSCVRAEVVVANVAHRILADNVGYIKIDYFSQRTVENLVAAMDALRSKNALSRGLILDLRQNTGGTMKEAARSADQFLNEGLLLRTVGPNGEHVQNLQGRMDAVKAGNEPEIPIIVLVDEQTASGAEILAGALFELDRAALVGYTTYGKGTVQKIYNLDERVRLKLTVAQYILEHDRLIAEGGLVPDVVLAPIALDARGARFLGWDEERAGVSWESIVPVVTERDAPARTRVDPDAFAIELARRALTQTNGTSRAATLTALQQVASAARTEQTTRLQRLFEAKGLDWSAPNPPSDEPLHARVRLVTQTDATQPDTQRVAVVVENLDNKPLYRAMVELGCDSFDPWSGLVIPVGKIPAGGRVQGWVSVNLPPGIETREDVVRVRLRTAGRPPLTLDEEVLRAGSSAPPRLAASVRLVEEDDHHRATVVLRNLSNQPADHLRIAFDYPKGLDVELLEGQVTVPRLEGRAEARISLPLRIGPTAPEHLPLTLTIDADRFRRIAEWTVDLPVEGPSVNIEAPRILRKDFDLAAPIGKYRLVFQAVDERAIDHVVVTANGRKVTWAGGGTPRLDIDADIELEPGFNSILVVAEDDQGLTARKQIVLRGESVAASADAEAHDTD